jgi:hypothetical protein
MSPTRTNRVTFSVSEANGTISLFILDDSGRTKSALYAKSVSELKRMAVAWITLRRCTFDETELADKLATAERMLGGDGSRQTVSSTEEPIAPSPSDITTAEYAVDEVHYNIRGDRIERVTAREVKGFAVGPPTTLTRGRLVALAEERRVVMLLKLEGGRLAAGPLVRTVLVRRSKYLRIDGQRMATDNLG